MQSDYEDWLFELLEKAQAWPEAEIAERAQAACEGGPVSADELLAALNKSLQLGEFLEQPAWDDQGDLLQEVHLAAHPENDWQIGEQVGRYRLLEALGKGGMGQVFLAEQEEPYRRVALKLNLSGELSAGARQRFRAEQQALARLNHPNIAQFHEADLTENGKPYFAMEWVDGQPIDKFFRGRSFDLRERLQLFLDICAAVRHAHQKQIVHRDLKPSNILVQELDGKPVVKVIDFGISEALDRPAPEVRLSESGGIYGTPEFLSPESFDGDIDTRADVYSLGVLLYELLSGTRPFRRENGGVSELIERIRRGEASLPSQAASKHAGQIRGDLDAIVMKAMHPDREHRFDTVADLSADIQRFLNFEPISARSTGTWHQLMLLARRRRTPAIAAAVALTSMIIGSVGAGIGMVRARQEAEATRIALQESEALSSFLADLFQESDPGRAKGQELSAREILDQGAERLRSNLLQGQPLTRARLVQTVGDIYAKMGYYDEAGPLLEESLELFRSRLSDTHPEVAAALHSLAVMKTKEGVQEEAKQLLQQALVAQESNAEVEPSKLALTVYHLGVIAFRRDEWAQAEVHFDRACAIWRGVDGEDEHRARCFEAFGALRVEQKKSDEAESLYLQSLQLREQALGEDHPHVAASLQSLCILNYQRLHLEAAQQYCDRALSIRRKVFGEQHAIVAATIERLAVIRRLQQRYEDAELLFSQALGIVEGQPSVDLRQQARLSNRSAWVSWLKGDYAQAEERYRKAFEIYGSSLQSGISTAGNALLGIGLTKWKRGRLDEAEDDLQRTYDYFLERSGPQSSGVGWAAWGLAGVYRDRQNPSTNDLDRAEPLYRQSLDIRRRLYPEGHEYLVLNEADFEQYLQVAAAQETSTAGSLKR